MNFQSPLVIYEPKPTPSVNKAACEDTVFRSSCPGLPLNLVAEFEQAAEILERELAEATSTTVPVINGPTLVVAFRAKRNNQYRCRGQFRTLAREPAEGLARVIGPSQLQAERAGQRRGS